MTEAEFRDAVDKGLGRAVLFVAQAPEGVSPTCLTTILERCTTCTQWDMQVEGDRAPYLYRLAEAARCLPTVFDAVITKLPESVDRDRRLMIRLMREYARSGDARAKQVLSAVADQGDETAQDCIVELSLSDFLEAVERFIPTMSEEDSYRASGWFDDARDAWGREAVDEALRERTGPGLERLRGWVRLVEERLERPFRPVLTGPWTLDAFLREVDSQETPAKWRSAARQFRLNPVEGAIEAAASLLLSEQDPARLEALAHAFRFTPYPLDPMPLVDLAEASDEPYYVRTLERVKHPVVREFALRLLAKPEKIEEAVGLLKYNLKPGDESRIESAILGCEETDEDFLHGLSTGLLVIVGNHPKLDWSPSLLWLYDRTPCSFCRNGVVEGLIAAGTAPHWLLEEATEDAESDTREAATLASQASPSDAV